MANNKYVLVDEDFQSQVLDMLKDLNQVVNRALATKVEALPTDLMDTVDTMAYLKVSRRTLFKYRTKSGLPSIKKNNGKIYYWRHKIDEFFNKSEEE